MAISVGVARPGTISGTGNAPGGTISFPSAGITSPNAAYGTVANYAQQQIERGANSLSQADPYGNISKLLADSQASTAALLAKYQQQAYAPKLDYAAINAQARSSAENAVNPYYTKQLNDFLAQQAASRAQTQAQTETNIQNLQDQLNQTLQGNEIAGQRTTEDVAKNQGQINQTADQFQTDTGQQFTADRLALARTAGQGGLGAQQIENATLNRNTSEKRQEEQFQSKREEQQLFKARTFEDLARSGSIATGAKEKGTKQQQVDLANFIQNQGLDLTSKQSELATKKEADIISKTQAERGSLVQNFINSISNPAQRQAALQAYGGLL